MIWGRRGRVSGSQHVRTLANHGIPSRACGCSGPGRGIHARRHLCPLEDNCCGARTVDSGGPFSGAFVPRDVVGNQLAAVFYDFIVYTLPDTLTDKSRIGLGNFIPVIRSAHRVSTISATVGREVESFAALVENTGLRGPQAAAQLLPVNAITVPEAEGDYRTAPHRRPGTAVGGVRVERRATEGTS